MDNQVWNSIITFFSEKNNTKWRNTEINKTEKQQYIQKSEWMNEHLR